MMNVTNNETPVKEYTFNKNKMNTRNIGEAY